MSWTSTGTLSLYQFLQINPLPLFMGEQSHARALCEVVDDHTDEETEDKDRANQVVNEEEDAVVLGSILP